MPGETVNQRCPQCHAGYHLGPDHFGRRIKCGKCGQEFQASPPPPPVMPPPVLQPIDEFQFPIVSRQKRTTKAPWSKRKKWIVGIVAVLLIGGLFGGRNKNARCRVCGHEFYISDQYKDSVAQWTRQFQCPNCGVTFPAAVFYKQGASPAPRPEDGIFGGR
jgi:ribosomal protein S27AE